MWVSICRCFKFCWLKRNFPTRTRWNQSSSSSSILFICFLFFYLTYVASEQDSHRHRHHHGDGGGNRSNVVVEKFRFKRQHHAGDGPWARQQQQYGYQDRRDDSYRPESYVMDEQGQREPESGPWGEWTGPSECSRSCGGGVAAQERRCRDARSDGTSSCTGALRRYFSCNIHDCPEGSGDFRSEQCSAFNGVPFEGRTYDWIPYTKAPNKCELNCMPRGERFYYRHKRKVTDGTRCDEEKLDICVDGRCLPVGCDMMLGSTAQEDKCRSCGGDGSYCNTITGIFDQNNMQVGYNDILLIPSGATNIVVRETSPSNNYLAIRNVTGHYYLNGNWRIDFPSEMTFAGTIFHYDRKAHSFHLVAPESIRALGPITEALYIVILYQEANSGVEYEYSLPQGIVLDRTEEYTWIYGEFSQCSASCGGGNQHRQISCARRSTMEHTDHHLCDPTNKPNANQTCNSDPCPIRWYARDWEDCDAPCGENGTQIRTVFCEQTVSGVSAVVHDARCVEELGPMPDRVQNCSRGGECPTWFVGEWLPCDHLCGDGHQKRVVKCHTHDANGKVVIHNDDKCKGKKPVDSEPCFLEPCDGVDWVTSPWSGCEENCGSTKETRDVHCSTAKGKVFDDEYCHEYRKPEGMQECEQIKPCEYSWYAAQWSKCTSRCGPGFQTRHVFCGETKEDGSIVKVNETKCEPESKYDGERNCTGTADDCKGTWVVGPWSKCSKECGGGRKERSVICMSGNETLDVNKCDQENILFASENCNDDACGADEIMTLMPEHEVDEEDDECEVESVESTQPMDMDDLSTTSLPDDDAGSGSGFSDVSAVTMGMEDTSSSEDGETGKTTSSDEDGTEITSLGTASLGDVMTGSTSSMMESSMSSSDSPSMASSISPVDSMSSSLPSASAFTPSELGSGELITTAADDSTTDGSGSGSGDSVTSSGSGDDESTTTVTSEYSTINVNYDDDLASRLVAGSGDDQTESSMSSSSTTEASDESSTSTEGEMMTSEILMSSTIDNLNVTEMSTDSSVDSLSSSLSPDSSMSSLSLDESTVSFSDDTTVSGMRSVSEQDDDVSGDGSGTDFDSLMSSTTESGTSIDTAISEEMKVNKCKPRTTPKVNCTITPFGCCPTPYDESVAKGPFGFGCPRFKTCKETKHGCCLDGVSVSGPKGKGCPMPACDKTLFGCCEDKKNAALGNDYEGCPKETEPPTPSTKPPPTTTTPKPIAPCSTEPYGCCDDGRTSAHGPNKEGCCLSSNYGCCWDNVVPAAGPNFEGCSCLLSPNGCCPDNSTAARGPGMEGCGCTFTEHGCCEDGYTTAAGANYDGCPCQSFKFQCCEDGITVAKGPNKEGCGCQYSEFGCCPDRRTPAAGPNQENCGCESSFYGCCPDGISEARGEDFEGCEDVPIKPGDVCGLDKERGSCRNFTVKWFFDMEYGGCSRFWYGGCDGNNNRFSTQDECKAVCVEPEGRDACYLPRVAGPCEGYYPSWYYDATRERCEQFIFSGCLGNNNRFQTRENCENTCLLPDRVDACDQPKTEGPCRGNYTRFSFDKESESCTPFTYGGCKGNANNFLTEKECHQRCKEEGRVREVCFLPKAHGKCGEKLARWYYDVQEQRCLPFYYAGCQGNANRFPSLDDCERTCPKALLAENICILPQSLGDCTSYTERFHFDAYTGNCKAFVYSGCGGNPNNFLSIDECRNKCERASFPQPQPVFNERHCFMAPEQGTCEENQVQLKWFYDSRDGVCRNFHGCFKASRSNLNRFDAKEECEDKCSLSQDICQLPQVVGPCTGAFLQYYYDAESDSCIPFEYGGCEGNTNRFDSQVMCEQRCKKDLPGSYPDHGDHHHREYEHPESPYHPEERPAQVPETTIAPSYVQPDREHDICQLPIETGPCRASIPSWYFNPSTRKCEGFTYGGCNGNANRFDTEEQCERQCGQFKGQDVCGMPADIGPCRSRIAKWYFSRDDQTCQQFLYGGCQGNGNRFTAQEECESVCLSRSEILPTRNDTISGAEICRLPVDIGPCNDGYKRFFYDASQKSCIPFAYGGCAGNLNRFKSFDICLSFCNQFLTREERHHQQSPPTHANSHHPLNSHDSQPQHNTDHHHSHDDEDESSEHDFDREITAGPGRGEEVGCTRETYECEILQCPYGVEKYVAAGGAGCTTCRCMDPCRDQRCPEGTQCAVDVSNAPHGHGANGPLLQPVCRRVNKPGICPNLAPSRVGICEQECQSDADCSTDMKCCFNGCGSSCLVPLHHETNEITDEQEPVAPGDPGGRGARIVGGELSVIVEEGSLATLECIARGNPEPTITWRKGDEKISGEQGRFRILGDGSLQIIGVWRADEGTFTCVADNGVARPAHQSVRLNVTEAIPRQAVVVDDNPNSIVTLGAPASMRCFAVGWPRPSVTWWRGDRMLPFSSERYEQLRDFSLLIRLVSLRDLGPYTCQAYNGLGKAASWTVTLQAVGPVHTTHPDDQEYLKFLVSKPQPPSHVPSRPRPPPRIPPAHIPLLPTTTTTSTQQPPHRLPDENEIIVPSYLVPLRATINLEKTVFTTGSEVSIPCEVEGYPLPRVLWYHEEDSVPGSDPRARVLEDHTLVITNATTSDSGTYRVELVNDYGVASSSVTIQVEGAYLHPNCTDNPFFANCKLIVKASYCTNRYYAKFCCKSCTLAGQLPKHGPHLSEYGQAYFGRPRTSFVTRE